MDAPTVAAIASGVAAIGGVTGLVALYHARALRAKIQAEAEAIRTDAAVAAHRSAVETVQVALDQIRRDEAECRRQLREVRARVRALEAEGAGHP